MVSARPLMILAAALAGASVLRAAVPADYPGTPYQGKIQEIPGRFFLSDFDQGPKNVVWHDYQTKNPWACKLRDSTGVGMQLMGQGGDKGDTKEADSLVKARQGKCYLAETNTGDWTKYTVKVKQAGSYKLNMLTAAQGTTIPFVGVSMLNSKDSTGTGQITLPLTSYFHAWVYTRGLATLSLDTGTQVIRFDIVGNGPMNIDYIDFEYAGTAALDPSAHGTPTHESGIAVGRLSALAGGELSLDFSAAGKGPVRIRAFDASGAKLAEGSAEPADGAGRFTFQSRKPASGLVFLELTQGAAKLRARSIIASP
jgi:hypothetical protein